MSETRFFEQQDGSKIAYKILESANAKNEVPLVSILGMGETKEQFVGYDEELAKYQQVIVFDNRGIGESTVASFYDPITVELLAQDTIGLIKHLGFKRFNLFGKAMGAKTAFIVALRLPSDLKLEKLVIVSGSPRINSDSIMSQRLEQIYNLPEMKLPKTIQEQKDHILGGYENELSKYFLEHPDKLDKFAELILSTNPKRPFEIF
ncbi:6330_t:CDS:2, partial [Gigaspora rosea]